MNDKMHPLKEILSTVNHNSCPFKLNFHCHTTESDGSLEPLQLFYQACNLGLEHIAITDHHSVNAYRHIKKAIQSKAIQLNPLTTIWSGIEITCLLNKCMVHIIGLGFDVNRLHHSYTFGESVTGNLLQAEVVVDEIHKANGLAILAHPARYRLDFSDLIDKANCIGIDGAEAWYDYDYKESWSYTPFVCIQIEKRLRELNLLSSCGTDSHGYSLTSR